MKTRELTGAALDWAVAIANKETYEDYRIEDDGLLHAKFCEAWLSHSYSPSTNWLQGGPIIDREKIWTGPAAYIAPSVLPPEGKEWMAKSLALCPQAPTHGPTPLIAAMRCFVASKLGDEVEIPEELK